MIPDKDESLPVRKEKRVKFAKRVEIIDLDDSETSQSPNTRATHQTGPMKRRIEMKLKRGRPYDSDESDEDEAPVCKRIQVIDLTGDD